MDSGSACPETPHSTLASRLPLRVQPCSHYIPCDAISNLSTKGHAKLEVESQIKRLIFKIKKNSQVAKATAVV